MLKLFRTLIFAAVALGLAAPLFAQGITREISVRPGDTVEVINGTGRIDVIAYKETTGIGDDSVSTIKLSGTGSTEISENDLRVDTGRGRHRITVRPANPANRFDIALQLPERVKLVATTREGEVRAQGNFQSFAARTETGTIAADVPTIDLRYSLQWVASRPRYLADFEIADVKEKAAGRFEIKGRYEEPKPERVEGNGEGEPNPRDLRVELNLTTDRGIILLNVPPNEVAGDLRERPLTEAAKAIVRSGDSILMEAIRRASPKYFGDYAQTLPPLRRTPTLTERDRSESNTRSSTKVATVQVTDADNRSVTGLTNGDFEISEDNEARDIISVRPVSAPVNLVLLLDVSGSVENYVNFIRKAARSFVDTVDKNDRISIVIFSEDVKVLSGFTTDRQLLSESLDTFDAGGPTAYYDALAYTLADTLRPLGGERTAIVILTDGDDNRSFLAFDSLAGTIQESGALIYPLYVPSSLIAASASAAPVTAVDPLRARYLGLSTRAEGEGEQLAKLSGGVYYSISQLSQIQTAYEDIARQLRSAYEVTYRSQIDGAAGGRISPRLRVRVKRPDLFVSISRVSPK